MADNAATTANQPATGLAAAPWLAPFARLMAQPALRRSIPAIATIGGLAAAGVLYLALAQGPQRVLYSSLSDRERASVVASLEQNTVDYTIDPATGMIKVAEDDLYRARMLVASDGGLAAVDTGGEMLDSIPLGASRTLEGERLRLSREHELQRTILEIDGIEAARVHLATPERSVFLRENDSPSASVMVRLVRGRSLDPAQVNAIVNLVSGSVAGLASANVRVVDQSGRLLTAGRAPGSASEQQMDVQLALEAKLRDQLAQLLVPLLGEGNFSSEVQVELDRDEVTSARESYGNDSVVRQESQSRSLRQAAGGVGGVPGVLSNTPPPPTSLVDGPPAQQQTQGAGTTGPADSEESASRIYEVGREVAVTSTRPGGIERISVAVAVSDKALAKIKPANADRLSKLIEAAVGANANRGDRVEVLIGKFEPLEVIEPAFYDRPWFSMLARQLVAILAVVLFLLGVRPVAKAIRKRIEEGASPGGQRIATGAAIDGGTLAGLSQLGASSLKERVALARRLAVEQPEHAAQALRRMLAAPGDGR